MLALKYICLTIAFCSVVVLTLVALKINRQIDLVHLSLEMKRQQPTESIGRYQIVQMGTFRRDQYLLDTQTGRNWRVTCTESDKKGECLEEVWIERWVETIHEDKGTNPFRKK